MADLKKHSQKEIMNRLRWSLYIMPHASMREIEDTLIECWHAWEKHPDYDYIIGESGGYLLGAKDAMKTGNFHRFFSDVFLAGVFKHDPGKQGIDESYIFGTPQTVLSRVKWAKRTWGGELVGVLPLEEWVSVSHIHICWLSNSLKGAGRGIECRRILREQLPAKARKYVSKGRQYARLQKWVFFNAGRAIDPDLVAELRKDGKKSAAWARKQPPKWKLFWEYVLDEEAREAIYPYFSPEIFWKAATGQMNPYEIPSHNVPPLLRYAGIDVPLKSIKVSPQATTNPEAKPLFTQPALL